MQEESKHDLLTNASGKNVHRDIYRLFDVKINFYHLISTLNSHHIYIYIYIWHFPYIFASSQTKADTMLTNNPFLSPWLQTALLLIVVVPYAVPESMAHAVRRVNRHGPFLGVVVPNAFEMDPLLRVSLPRRKACPLTSMSQVFVPLHTTTHIFKYV
jgi:hypothetical protein